MLIVLEGLDGVGKTTQANLLKAHLEKKGYAAIMSSELQFTELGRTCRELLLNKDHPPASPEVEACLFFAGRLQALEEVIQPKLEEGYFVILDRYYTSSLAMQGYASGHLSLIKSLVELFKDKLIKPQIYLYLKCTNHDIQARVKARGDKLDWFESHDQKYHQKVSEYFENNLLEADLLSAVVDANGSIEEVHERIVKTVDKVVEDYLFSQFTF